MMGKGLSTFRVVLAISFSSVAAELAGGRVRNESLESERMNLVILLLLLFPVVFHLVADTDLVCSFNCNIFNLPRTIQVAL